MLNKLRSPWLWVGIIFVVLGIWVASGYNRLVGLEQSIDGQWAQVESVYQRRLDLIGNVVQTVQGIAIQEQEVFGRLAEARTRYAGATGANQQVTAASEIESAFARLLVVVENYPQLRSSDSFRDLTVELSGSENRIQVERQRYNSIVRDYNIAIRRFPTNILAGIFGFEPRTFFEAQEGAENAPRVDFNSLRKSK